MHCNKKKYKKRRNNNIGHLMHCNNNNKKKYKKPRNNNTGHFMHCNNEQPVLFYWWCILGLVVFKAKSSKLMSGTEIKLENVLFTSALT